MKITSESEADFESSLERFYEHMLTLDGPLKVSASVRVADGHATILGSVEPHQRVPGFQRFDTDGWPCGDRIFAAFHAIQARLLDEGRVVYFSTHDAPSCSHVLTLVYGTWAHDGSPVHNHFAFRGSDEEAFVLALRYGARMEKACDFLRTMR